MNKTSIFSTQYYREMEVFKLYNFRTDLALERRELLEKASKEEIKGIDVEEKEISDKLKIYKVKVTNEEGEKAIRQA